MATAEELLSATGNASDTITVDLDTRKMTIPETITNLGVMSDDDVKWLYFVVPRYYRNVDLSEFDIRINFKNAAGNGDQYPVPGSDIEVDEATGQIKFSWRIDRTAYEKEGAVTFSMCMVKYDAEGAIVQELNSTTATLNVLAGLETIEAVVENNPSAFDNVLFRLKAVENAMGLGVTGYYNIIDVNIEDDISTLTIASHDGEIEYTITDGVDGEDGYTPVKGVDYFTEEEKSELETEIVDEVTSYVDAWTPDAYVVNLLSTGWVDNQQTVTIDSVTTDNLVFVGPEISETNRMAYSTAGIQCIAQAESQLTFSCTKQPETDIVVNVCVYHSDVLTDDIQTSSSFYKVVGAAVDTYLEENPVAAPTTIKGSGPPTTSTEGDVGYLYIDTNDGEMYKCVAVVDGVYTWENIVEPVDTQPQVKVTEVHTSISGDIYTMTLTLEDGSTSVNVVEVTDGLPTKITVDGVEIPLTWEEVTT